MLTQPHDDSMFDEFVTDDVPELENPPVNDALDTIRQDVIDLQSDVTELLTLLRPLAGLIEAMPEAMSKIGPLIDGLKNSPVVKMLGIKL